MLLTIADIEKDSRISHQTWRRWIKRGQLKVIRMGRRIRIDEGEYRAFISRCRTIGGDPDAASGA